MSCKCGLCPDCGRYFTACECEPKYQAPENCQRCLVESLQDQRSELQRAATYYREKLLKIEKALEEYAEQEFDIVILKLVKVYPHKARFEIETWDGKHSTVDVMVDSTLAVRCQGARINDDFTITVPRVNIQQLA